MLTKDKILELWNNEYKKLASFLISNAGGNSLSYLKGKLLNDEEKIVVDGHSYSPSEIVAYINSIMIPFKDVVNLTNPIYYRGDSNFNIPVSCTKENYISVTNQIDNAFLHIKDIQTGLLSFITIHNEVKCIKTNIDGELLLEPGCLWEVLRYTNDYYADKGIQYNRLDVVIKPPVSTSNAPLCSKLISDSILGTFNLPNLNSQGHLENIHSISGYNNLVKPYNNSTLISETVVNTSPDHGRSLLNADNILSTSSRELNNVTNSLNMTNSSNVTNSLNMTNSSNATNSNNQSAATVTGQSRKKTQRQRQKRYSKGPTSRTNNKPRQKQKPQPRQHKKQQKQKQKQKNATKTKSNKSPKRKSAT